MRTIRCILLCGVLLAYAFQLSAAAEYGYPFQNPYEATVLGTPPAFQAELPEDIPNEERWMQFPGQEFPSAFWYNDRMFYSTALQDGPAPLVFVIAGTGAPHNGSKTFLLMRMLWGAGFHVVNLSSPTFPNFLVAASSTQVPGYLPDDAEDLYTVMQQVRDVLLEEEGPEFITDYCLTGYSLGGAHAAAIARMDEEAGIFDFKNVLCINPPVNLYTSTGLLDGYVESPEEARETFRRLINKFAAFYKRTEFLELTDDFLYRLYMEVDIPIEDLRTAIGISFRLSSANMVFSSDACLSAGYIIPAGHTLQVTESLERYMLTAVRVSFHDYFDEYLVPFLRYNYPGLSREDIMENMGLHRLAPWLRTAEHVHLITNEDELILTDADVDFLRDVFGERGRIYPNGGHCGNMAYVDNARHTVEVLSQGVFR